ncbi:hypothetical protein [Raoultella ornithinolytica]|uniref:hypothetical protein n=2 Tax=Raoultella ornithinolytica TaxID=54291 RepID=UPI00387F8C70
MVALDALTAERIALAVVAMDAFFAGVEASEAKIKRLSLSNSFHWLPSLVFIFGNFAPRHKKINQKRIIVTFWV